MSHIDLNRFSLTSDGLEFEFPRIQTHTVCAHAVASIRFVYALMRVPATRFIAEPCPCVCASIGWFPVSPHSWSICIAPCPFSSHAPSKDWSCFFEIAAILSCYHFGGTWQSKKTENTRRSHRRLRLKYLVLKVVSISISVTVRKLTPLKQTSSHHFWPQVMSIIDSVI